MNRVFFTIIFLVFMGFFLPAIAQEADPNTANPKGSGAPVPRFASLNDDEANLRTGPGFRYPIVWKYHRKNMPVEIIAEFDTWRKIRDWRGTEGWVHRAMLSPRRTGIVKNKKEILRARDREASSTLAEMEQGVIVTIEKCPKDWCKIKVESFRGWMKRDSLWGLYPKEEIN